jgi:hypothetical protein
MLFSLLVCNIAFSSKTDGYCGFFAGNIGAAFGLTAATMFLVWVQVMVNQQVPTFAASGHADQDYKLSASQTSAFDQPPPPQNTRRDKRKKTRSQRRKQPEELEFQQPFLTPGYGPGKAHYQQPQYLYKQFGGPHEQDLVLKKQRHGKFQQNHNAAQRDNPVYQGPRPQEYPDDDHLYP